MNPLVHSLSKRFGRHALGAGMQTGTGVVPYLPKLMFYKGREAFAQQLHKHALHTVRCVLGKVQGAISVSFGVGYQLIFLRDQAFQTAKPKSASEAEWPSAADAKTTHSKTVSSAHKGTLSAPLSLLAEQWTPRSNLWAGSYSSRFTESAKQRNKVHVIFGRQSAKSRMWKPRQDKWICFFFNVVRKGRRRGRTLLQV